MKRTLSIAALIATAMMLVATSALAEEGGPSREEYVAQVEPICQANTVANKRILKNVKERARDGKLKLAGSQFIHAAAAFGATVKKIVAVQRPPADNDRLVKWFGFLGIVRKDLHQVGKALLEGDKIKATHESIRLQRSGNAANNVGFVFGFDYCRVTPSRFT
jgi:hypothetical protein